MRLEKFSHGWFAFLAIFALFFGACGESSSEDSVNAPKTSENFSESPEGSNSSSGSTFGTLTDIRDGQSYKTVSIGTQTWMAENLNYETTNSYCYDDNVANCTKYGRLYTWAAAMDSVGTWSTNGKGCGYNWTGSPTYPVRGVCPDGWRLPTVAELDAAVSKSTSGWNYGGNGTDAFGFSALPAGLRDIGGNFGMEGDYAYFWSSTVVYGYADFAYSVKLDYGRDYSRIETERKDIGLSVRCLKN